MELRPRERRPGCIEDLVRRRAGHVMVTYKNKLFMWGGYMELPHEGTYNLMTESASYFHDPSEIWIYESLLNIWHRKICNGEVPMQVSGACAGVIGNYMYLFGGYYYDPPFDGNQNQLWRLDLDTFEWKFLTPNGTTPFSCDKSSSWVYRDRFYIFGGFGPRPSPFSPPTPIPVAFDTEDNTISITSKGWFDQLVYYDSSKDAWVWPSAKGTKPSARAAHAAAVLKSKVYVFGGRHKSKRLSDFYCLDLDTHKWSFVPHGENSAAPLGRSWHTMTVLSEDKLLLYGGFSTECQVLSDVWIFHPRDSVWRELSRPTSSFSKRLWHCGACLRQSDVIFLGGISNNILNDSEPKDHAEDMLRIRFTPPSLFELTLEYISSCKHLPRKSWSHLTPLLQKILQVRTDPFEIHGIN